MFDTIAKSYIYIPAYYIYGDLCIRVEIALYFDVYFVYVLQCLFLMFLNLVSTTVEINFRIVLFTFIFYIGKLLRNET